MGLRIIFMGTPEFSVPALRALHESDHEVIAVYSQPPRPKGRGQQVQKSPVQQYAEDNDIPVFNPKSLKNGEAQDEFKRLGADVAVVAAYGLILPKAILDAPRYGCINIHASILPRWRGASPIQHAIWSGDTESGVTLMQMDVGLDTGPMIAIEKIKIDDAMTSSQLHDRLSEMGGPMIVKTIDELAAKGKLNSVVQNDEDSVYAPMLKKDNGRINWTQSAAMISRQVRALNPWPGTFTELNGKRIRILEVALTNQKADKGAEGEIIDKKGNVVTGDGTIIQLLKIQPDGKSAMDFISAANGGYVKPGGKFS